MDQPVEIGQGRGVAQHAAAEGVAVQPAGPVEQVRAEPPADGGEHGAARRLDLARQLVGVDQGGAPLAEQGGHRRFAGGDVPGEGDVEHGRVR
jgi:hypothetical protein